MASVEQLVFTVKNDRVLVEWLDKNGEPFIFGVYTDVPEDASPTFKQLLKPYIDELDEKPF